MPGASFVFENELGAIASALSTANGIDSTNVDKIAKMRILDLFNNFVLKINNKKEVVHSIDVPM